MIELIQFPWSPFCIVQRRILEFSGTRFKITNISPNDRSLVWKLTKHRYYGVPILRDGRTVVFETSDDSQVIAKYLDAKLQLDLFPKFWHGTETILWRYIENEVEGPCFKLNDIYRQEFVAKKDQLQFLRFKERKFGRGCIDHWRKHQADLLDELAHRLIPFELMLEERKFLLDDKPHFVDFDLYGMLANFLFSGHYQLPAIHTRLSEWFPRMSKLTKVNSISEKLRS
jgi:glutathione S-transferase